MNNIVNFHRLRKVKWLKDLVITILVASVTGLFLAFFPLTEKYEKAPRQSNSDPVGIPDTITGKAAVTDGDSVTINGTVIRLHGIDAPEIDQTCWKNSREYQCGMAAKTYLEYIINNQVITCHIYETDTYGRDVAKCFNDTNIDLNAQMVSSGNAIAYLYFSHDYSRQQAEAKKNKKGIWAGHFIEPYRFRRR